MRKIMRACAALVAVAALGCSDDPAAPLPTLLLVTNGGFETGDLTGWMKSGNSGATDVSVGNGTTAPGSGLDIPPPAEGVYGAMFDQTIPATLILYRDITIPAGYTSADFTALIYIHNYAPDHVIAPTAGLAYDGGETNQQFRIDVMSPGAALTDVGAGVLQNIYRTDPGEPLEENLLVTANLAAFAGQTVRLRFAAVVTTHVFNVGVDAVQVTAN